MTYPAYKECVYCGRNNPAHAMQCAGCGAGSFGAVQTDAGLARQPMEVVPPFPSGPVPQIELPIRIIFFILVGFLVAFYWLLAALVLLFTIVAQPLALAMFRILPTVTTLHRGRELVGYTLRQGWQGTVARYVAAPWWGKVVAPLAFVGYIVSIIFFLVR